MSEIKEKSGDVRLSYSSLGTLQTCEQKFAHYKIYKTPNDPDYEESDALAIGKAFHQVLEKTNHKAVHNKDVDEALMDHNVPKINKNIIIAMAMKAVEINKASGLEVIMCEFEISHMDYVGYIDFIAVEGSRKLSESLFDKYWWMGDLKSAGNYDAKLIPRLPLDLQLNLYAYFVPEIARALGLDTAKFRGFKYRQVTKSKATQADNESDAEFIKRLITPAKDRYNPSGPWKAPVEVRDFTIPFFTMKPKMAWDIIQENLIRARELQQGEAPKRNFKACMDFFKPCQYFSQCHGTTHTDGYNYVKVSTINSYVEKDVL